MKITALRIVNYKGFLDSTFVKLNGSWNVVVGQNNAGKTAFMEGFRFFRNEDRPHRNITFSRDFPLPPNSWFGARMTIGRRWLKNAWLRRGGIFELPVSGTLNGENSLWIDPDKFFDGEDLNVEIEFSRGQDPRSSWPSHRLFEANSNHKFFRLEPTPEKQVGPIGNLLSGGPDGLPAVVQAAIPAYVYAFEAKRFALGECGHEDTSVLRPDASNLPAVLIKLASNPDLFDEFNDNVTAVFPSIKGITVTTKGNNFEIRVWSVDPSTRRDDLSIPLNESGAGIGQVLAILYVAMTNEAGVIAIDEPNSFLHPGAARKLIQILKHYPQHQYIISTHSPEVIGVAQPATLHLVRFDGEQSRIETFGEAEIETKRMMLEEVGASLTDVFGAERVIWVEGPTERECFDLIVERLLDGPVVGLAFVALRNTGDFERKSADAKAVLDIYDALSRGGSILPVTVAFSFDEEGKTEKQIADLKRRCGGRACVLPRRMTENYLLDPNAIATVLTKLGEAGITAAQIEELLRLHTSARMPKGSEDAWGSDGYFKKVDGARLLEDVFHEATDGRQEYRKVRDAVELLRVILDVVPSKVDELAGFVRGLIRSGDTDTRETAVGSTNSIVHAVTETA